jgi:hypothetical protein
LVSGVLSDQNAAVDFDDAAPILQAVGMAAAADGRLAVAQPGNSHGAT